MLNEAEILEAFQSDGYVVVTGVFDQDLVTQSITELWESPQLLRRSTGIVRDDRRTWTADKWPQSDGGRNFLEPLDPYQVQATWELAQHKHANDVMQVLWREHQDVPGERVFMSGIPRWGVMRPTANNPEWRTEEKWLHWDQNPWAQPGFDRVQAFAQLSDSTGESGGLLVVPGFHKEWAEWGLEHPIGTVYYKGEKITDQHGVEKPFPVPEEDPVHLAVRRVVAPAGSLVIWDSRLPHQNFPNTSADQFRIIVYLSYVSRTENHELLEETKDRNIKQVQVMRALGQDGCYWPQQLTELGAEITGAPTQEQLQGAIEELDQDEKLRKAIGLTVESGKAELAGDLELSIALQRQAERTYPDICKWHSAIFS
jgi:hypothetical protein